MDHHIQQAITILKQGGVIIFPTDTAFAIGCRIDSPAAVSRLFAIKQRDTTQAVPVLVADSSMAQDYVLPIPQTVKEQLIDKYWPGALTIILPCIQEKVSSLVRGGGNTLGVRSPRHDVPQALLTAVNVPLIGTSANFHGLPTPYSNSQIDKQMIQIVDYILPGEVYGKAASTIIDCTKKEWQIVRQGEIIINREV